MTARFVANAEYPTLLNGREVEVVGFLANEYANEVRERMEAAPRGGRIYVRDGVPHKSSAPGEPPAPWSGELVESIAVSQPTGGALRADITVSGEAASYAPGLEFGTSRVAPRPVWQPAVSGLTGKRLTIPPPAGGGTTSQGVKG